MSKTEQIHEALKALLAAVPNTKVERNTAVPETIPAGGLIVLRDGDPGEPDVALGGVGSVYYSHDVDIELYLSTASGPRGGPGLYTENGDAAFDALVQAVGAALQTDPTLGGLAFGMTYARPEINTEAVSGAPAIKTGTIIVTVEYETDSLLG